MHAVMSYARTHRSDLEAKIQEIGLVACCRRKEHHGVILFCHRHGLESPLRYGCSSIASGTYYRPSSLWLKSQISDRIAGAPGAEQVLEGLSKSLEKDATISVMCLLDARGVPPAKDVLDSHKNLLENVQNYPSILARALKMVEVGAKPTERSQPSSRGLLVRQRPVGMSSFHDFGKLPLELRHMIWKFTTSSRAVELYHCKQRIKSTCPTPVALRINQESRAVALDQYSGKWRTNPEGEQGRNFNAIENVYFSYATDVLYFGNRSFAFEDQMCIIRHIIDRCPRALRKLKRIAVYMASNFTAGERKRFLTHMSHFTALEEVVLVLEDNVICFEQHETELVDYLSAGAGEGEQRLALRKAETMMKQFRASDVNAGARAADLPVFHSRLVRSYRMG